MIFAAVLPHTRLHGGVKRFYELGLEFKKYGHTFHIFTPEGKSATWNNSEIEVHTLDKLSNFEIEILFFTDKRWKDYVLNSNAKYKVYYHVGLKLKSRIILTDKRFHVLACSTNVYKHDKFWFGVKPFLAAGGINTKLFDKKGFEPIGNNRPITIMAYGRVAEKIKGTYIIVKACERLIRKYPNIRLLLFDSPQTQKMKDELAKFKTSVPFEFVIDHPVEKNPELYKRADIFVSAEIGAGWNNTVAEAMASGVPVISTKSGTLDLIIDKKTGLQVWRNKYSIANAIEKLIHNSELANSLANNARTHVEKFDWEILANKIIVWHQNLSKSL